VSLRAAGRAAGFLIVTGVVACAGARRVPAPPPAPPVEEGASIDSAVLVNAETERTGVDWEDDWIWRHYGRFRKKTVALASRNGRRYDRITIEAADHTEHVLFFDITGFFGK
jgi:hypothetical protein